MSVKHLKYIVLSWLDYPFIDHLSVFPPNLRFSMYVRLVEGQSLATMMMMTSQGGDASPPPVEEGDERSLPKSRLTFKLNERTARVAMWINQVWET